MLTVKQILRFGQFEVHLQTRLLHKNGLRIKLPEKSYQLLLILLESPGQVVTREQLRHRLWPMDVVIDFDHGLNKSIQKLREALGDSAECCRFIETRQRVGYRFIAPVHEAGLPEPMREMIELPVFKAPDLTRIQSPRPHWYRPHYLLAALSLFCLLGLATWLVLRHLWPPAHPIQSLAVLPLENLSGDPAQAYFVDGMTDELITELARIPNLRVVSRTSIMNDRGDHRPLREIARELRVEAIVEGSVMRSGNKIRINTQLIDAASDKHLWAQSFESDASDLVSLQDSVAREIAAQTRTRVATLPQPSRAETHIDPAAHDAYLRDR